MVLSLVLAESSIELVPKELVHHPSILKSAQRKKKAPADLILDQTYHHAAILRLGPRSAGRGRPDIAHFCLLLALGSPLSSSGMMKCYLHTRDNNLITVDPTARLPRNTDRFTSLLEQLFKERSVPPGGKPLLSIKPGSLRDLAEEASGPVVALTTEGVPKSMEQVTAMLAPSTNPVLLVGGFPTGHFSKETMSLAQGSYRIHKNSLEAWTIVARAIYDYEKVIGLERN
jgi:rRNA small subunit pseudouridine methyltransferase Nep1